MKDTFGSEHPAYLTQYLVNIVLLNMKKRRFRKHAVELSISIWELPHVALSKLYRRIVFFRYIEKFLGKVQSINQKSFLYQFLRLDARPAPEIEDFRTLANYPTEYLDKIVIPRIGCVVDMLIIRYLFVGGFEIVGVCVHTYSNVEHVPKKNRCLNNA